MEAANYQNGINELKHALDLIHYMSTQQHIPCAPAWVSVRATPLPSPDAWEGPVQSKICQPLYWHVWVCRGNTQI